MNAPRRVFLKAPARAVTVALLLLGVGCAPRAAIRPVAPVPANARAAVLDSVRAVLARAVADSAFPGAYAVVGTADGVLAEYGVGQLDAADRTRPSARTVWDLASLTKVVGTTSAMLQLVGSGRVALDTPVVRYLPDWRARGADRVTVRQLLAHASGLPAWRALYKESDTKPEALAQLFATPPDTAPGIRFLYSDLGFILLGQLVERVSGEPLDRYVVQHVFAPLGMRDTRYLPPANWRARVAPTEIDSWRQRHLRGEVHDENASRLEGVSGHAGLFSTAQDLSRFARAYLNGGVLDGTRVFDSATVATFTRVQDPAVSKRALGWETPTGRNSAGTRLSPVAFGHTGFTGTSLWMDPQRGVFVLLLTNRVNPTRNNTKVGGVRTALADAVVGAVERAGGLPAAGAAGGRAR
ncbi:MAG: beta-lactamase family protein [Gemmatimonadetes bacterium]|nr:beta-lactamase family protein [Gemmatimonadota bacterium]